MKKYPDYEYEIGEFTYFAGDIMPKVLWPGRAKLKVGKFCSIALGLTVYLGGNHPLDAITTFPIGIYKAELQWSEGRSSFTHGDVIIGNDVWIGDDVTIMSGSIIEDGAIVGAKSVVRGCIPAYTTAYGNPAISKKQRFLDYEIAVLQEIKWWDWSLEKVLAAGTLIQGKDVWALKDFYIKNVKE